MDNNKYKKWSIVFLSALVFFTLLAAAINYFADPYQLIRGDKVIKANERFSNVGLARHYDYDSLVLGTSMTENFSAGYINNKLNARCLKLCISGGTGYEQRLIAEEALSTGRAKFAIWGLDYSCFNVAPGCVREGSPLYLYSKNTLKKFQWLLSSDVFVLSLKKIACGCFHTHSRDFTDDFDNLYSWYKQRKQDFNFRHYKKSWAKKASAGDSDGAEDDTDQNLSNRGGTFYRLKDCFDANMYSVIKSSPRTVFYVFYPPYSVLTYCKMYRKSRQDFYDYLAFKKYVFERLSKCPNVRLYDFQADTELSHEFSRYRDLSHYDADVNQMMVDCFLDGRYLVTRENADQYIMVLRKEVEDADPESILKGI